MKIRLLKILHMIPILGMIIGLCINNKIFLKEIIKNHYIFWTIYHVIWTAVFFIIILGTGI